MKLIIHKLNDAFVKVECDRDLAQELSQHFSFRVPGYQFVPAFKNKLWDGFIRLYSIKDNTIYYGLIPYIQKFCDDREYTVVYDKSIDALENFSIKEAKDFIETLGIPEHLEQRDYQIDAFVHAIRNKRALLLSPTSSGKSFILYLIIRHIQQNCKKGLLIVPRTSLAEQMFSDFKSYGYDSDQYCHRQYAGKDKSTDKFLTITTWQSIYNLPKEYFEQFDFVLGDEAHDFKAKSLSTIMSNLENTEYRIGCTGTLDGTQTHKLVLEGLFGPVLKVITTKELMDNDQVSSLKIKCLVLKYSDEVCKLSRGWDYQAEIDYLVKCPQRNAFIKNLALSLKGNSLILFQLVEKHGKELMRLIDAEKKDRKVFFVHGGTDVETREQIRHLTDSHPLEGELLFEFGDTKIKCSENELIPLTDGTTKKAKYITETDDIDARWILNNKK